MTCYIDMLPPTTSTPHAGYTFWKFDAEPASDFDHTVGTLTIESPGHRIDYSVEEFPVSTGRGFLLRKLCGAIGDKNPHETSYECVIAPHGQVSCSCLGWKYGRGRRCKHLSSLLGCIENAWL